MFIALSTTRILHSDMIVTSMKLYWCVKWFLRLS